MGKRAGASCCACEWTSGLAVGRPVKQIVDRAPPRPYDPALYTVRRQDRSIVRDIVHAEW